MKLKKTCFPLFRRLFAILIGTFLLLPLVKGQPYKDINLSFEERVNNLISQMTLDEKISQMMDVAQAIPRLDIPAYNWWNEGLHGVARAGIATVFPQAIALGATWNDSLIYKVASVISDEFRAKYNDFQKKNQRGRYQGLTVWSPNINIFRDPRWGRGQETYGEDPYLTSRIGVSFVKGLQGNDPRYLKVVATPKHFAVHSGPEPERHRFDARIDERDFMETYSPAFEACIREAGAYSIMGAYNRYMGQACCASDQLLKKTLRDTWGFQGYVVSDCDAIADIYRTHKVVNSGAEAAACAVKAGCDLNCGNTFQYLKEAVNKGLISEKEIDESVRRLFMARFKLGLFDPPQMVKYAQIPFSVNNAHEHRQLALETARQSIVLLKNTGYTLPLKKNIRSIAVIGPNANVQEVMYGNYNGTPSKAITPLEGIMNKVSTTTKVNYALGCSWTNDSPALGIIKGEALTTGKIEGLRGEYFNNNNFEGKPFATRIDKSINLSWESNGPIKGMKSNDVSIRWTGKLIAPSTGEYMIQVTGDDGYRLYLDNKLFLESWQEQAATSKEGKINLKAGEKHDIKIEYFQTKGEATISLKWGKTGENPKKEALSLAEKSDAIVFIGGISPRLEGEEMKVNADGFSGGDRTKLDLPAAQENLLKELYATGKPVVLVLLNGSALAVNWANEKIPAILEAWYPGEEGGAAIADVLFGDYNPAGRLPVTFYKNVDQLPPFEDYNMKGRTYRYFEGLPLYGFGYGLSYTKFKYSNLRLPASVNAGDQVNVTADVENIGKKDGDEVVELYLSHQKASVPVANLSLQGFHRIHLKSGEKKKVEFVLNPRQLSVVDTAYCRVVEPGIVNISIGGQQPEKDKKLENVISAQLEIKGETIPVKE
ncbi:MAG: glycoside hydrolase family 3 C-terminal domain-containing protein [Bacteroidota bacterium]|nr:glycoside hydrolase family 3 C-terminal domain-containing protein [Bacteroidota bacterium]